MKVSIAFYRTRDADDAHAFVGHATVEAVDLADAIELARGLAATLDMPQTPDAMSITDAEGRTLFSGAISQPQSPANDDGDRSRGG
jgi:Tfp pilus assembly protein FimT